jgi:hypothetical protein
MIQSKLSHYWVMAVIGMRAHLHQARRFATGATALSLIATVFFVLSAVEARAQGLFGTCQDDADVAALNAPIAPWKGAPLRVVFAAEKPADGELSLIAPNGSVAAKSRLRHGGPPYFWFAEVATPAAGTWRATLTRAGCSTVTREIAVRDEAPPPLQATAGSLWPIRNSWSRATENLYSAWIEKLFDAPLDTEPSWKALHEVLRDRSRNFLYDYLGLNEDAGLFMRPDCADLPYFLRAYFAFKLGLPFGYSKCSRNGKCYGWSSIVGAEAGKQQGLAAAFPHFVRAVGDGVQSGNGRTSATDNNTDFYPVALKQDTLRPGTIYADPYGHILVLVRRVPQVGGAAGVFLAVDAEPDGSVTRKRFWRGNFLFAHDSALGSPGFKDFRPIVREQNGSLRRLTNAELEKNPQFANFSTEQSQLPVEAFYDRMDEVMSPSPLDPLRAMKEAITALEEQVKTRVTAVENGRKYQVGAHGDASMPDGAAIFATTGAWEDFATPARDFRLLIAIDVVRGFPDKVARQPARYAIPAGKSIADVKAELQSVLASELAARKFSYTRSDGSAWTLSLKDVVDRAGELEMAYNLNDCVELRWGAPQGSQEASTCKRHAPQAQRAKMTEYRTWFRERRWPSHA